MRNRNQPRTGQIGFSYLTFEYEVIPGKGTAGDRIEVSSRTEVMERTESSVRKEVPVEVTKQRKAKHPDTGKPYKGEDKKWVMEDYITIENQTKEFPLVKDEKVVKPVSVGYMTVYCKLHPNQLRDAVRNYISQNKKALNALAAAEKQAVNAN